MPATMAIASVGHETGLIVRLADKEQLGFLGLRPSIIAASQSVQLIAKPPNMTQSRMRRLNIALNLALLTLPVSLPAVAAPQPMQPNAKWGPWRPVAERRQANFDAGFSNLELGGYMEFEQACKRDTGLPEKQIEYRFRLSRLIEQIGTGKVETGCWFQGKLLHRYSSPAIRPVNTNVDCLLVVSPQGGGLNIRAEAGVNQSLIGAVGNGQVIKPNYHPASIIERDGRYWVAIVQPAKGWVSNGRPGDIGNLRICR